MYFISAREVLVSTEAGGNICVLETGSFFGEISLFHNIRRTATIQAQDVCEALMVSQSDFTKLLGYYPRMRKIMNEIAERRFAELQESESEKRYDLVKSDTNKYLSTSPKSPAQSLLSTVVAENDCVPILYPGEAMDFHIQGDHFKKDFSTIEEVKANEIQEKAQLANRIDELTACEGRSCAGSTDSVENGVSGSSTGASRRLQKDLTNENILGIPSITRLTQSRLGNETGRKDSVVSLTVSMHGDNGEEVLDKRRSMSNETPRHFKAMPSSSKSSMIYSDTSDGKLRSDPQLK